MKNLFDLSNRVAIITGASKGIGASMAKGLASFGAKVVISSRKQEAVDELATSFRKEDLEVTGIACHVGDEAQLKLLIDQTIETYGRLDIIINNAATNPTFGPIQQTKTGVFEKIMAVNLKAPFLLGNLAFPYLQKSGHASIIHISSVEGKKPSEGLGLYSVSKAALLSLTQSQAKEWGKYGIRVNAICPGLVKTKFSAALWQNKSILHQIEKHLPSGRMALPDEMAGLAIFLASDASSYCTGASFIADGGHLIAG